MSWNIRIIKNTNLEIPYYFIAEVFYKNDGSLNAYTKEPGITLEDDTYTGLKEYYKLISEAFEKEIIDIKEFDE